MEGELAAQRSALQESLAAVQMALESDAANEELLKFKADLESELEQMAVLQAGRDASQGQASAPVEYEANDLEEGEEALSPGREGDPGEQPQRKGAPSTSARAAAAAANATAGPQPLQPGRTGRNNARIHPSNMYYAEEPDFGALADQYPALTKFVTHGRDGRVHFDFTSWEGTRTLTATLLKADFGIEWTLPHGQLVPTLTNRANYIHWLHDLLQLSSPEDMEGVRGLDIGCGANLIYCLLGAAIYGWHMVGADVTEVALTWARKHVEANPQLAPLLEVRDCRGPQAQQQAQGQGQGQQYRPQSPTAGAQQRRRPASGRDAAEVADAAAAAAAGEGEEGGGKAEAAGETEGEPANKRRASGYEAVAATAAAEAAAGPAEAEVAEPPAGPPAAAAAAAGGGRRRAAATATLGSDGERQADEDGAGPGPRRRQRHDQDVHDARQHAGGAGNGHSHYPHPQNHDVGGILLPALRGDGERFAFTMCNPPFFESMSEANQNPGTACGGTEAEMVYPGGELAFIMRMVEDSVRLGGRVHWYSTMLGKKATLKVLRQELHRRHVTAIRTVELAQGKTSRWAIAWSFDVDPNLATVALRRTVNPALAAPVQLKREVAFSLQGSQQDGRKLLQGLQNTLAVHGAEASIDSAMWTVIATLPSAAAQGHTGAEAADAEAATAGGASGRGSEDGAQEVASAAGGGAGVHTAATLKRHRGLGPGPATAAALAAAGPQQQRVSSSGGTPGGGSAGGSSRAAAGGLQIRINVFQQQRGKFDILASIPKSTPDSEALRFTQLMQKVQDDIMSMWQA